MSCELCVLMGAGGDCTSIQDAACAHEISFMSTGGAPRRGIFALPPRCAAVAIAPRITSLLSSVTMHHQPHCTRCDDHPVSRRFAACQ